MMVKERNNTKARRCPVVFLLAAVVLAFSVQNSWSGPHGAEYFTNVELVNQDGKVLHFYDDVLKGKVVAINFMFTSCPYSCPLETSKLRYLQKLLGDHVGKDVFMYSITVDPARDTPEVLKAYMKKYKVGPGWQFLTGNEEDIKQIRRRFGMFREQESDIAEHNVNFILGNEATGQWVKKTPFDAPEVLVSLMLDRLPVTPLRSKRPSYAAVRSMPNISKGQDLFRSRCSSCHTIGGGDELGPDLLGVLERRDRQWLIRWLKEPDVMLEEKDPIAMSLFESYGGLVMPNVKLTDFDIDNLIRYLDQQSRSVRAKAAAERVGANSYFQPISEPGR